MEQRPPESRGRLGPARTGRPVVVNEVVLRDAPPWAHGVAPALIARSEEERIPDRGDRREQVVSDRCDFIDEYGLTFPTESSAECGPRDARGARDRGHRLATSHHPSPSNSQDLWIGVSGDLLITS